MVWRRSTSSGGADAASKNRPRRRRLFADAASDLCCVADFPPEAPPRKSKADIAADAATVSEQDGEQTRSSRRETIFGETGGERQPEAKYDLSTCLSLLTMFDFQQQGNQEPRFRSNQEFHLKRDLYNLNLIPQLSLLHHKLLNQINLLDVELYLQLLNLLNNNMLDKSY